jgi:hypothetical protein
MIDYLKLSVLIHLKDLVDKVEYFTFDPIFYNPLYFATPPLTQAKIYKDRIY